MMAGRVYRDYQRAERALQRQIGPGLDLDAIKVPAAPAPWTDADQAEYDRAAAEDRAEAVRAQQERDREDLVRFTPDGERIQYEDADDASEHWLRMAEGGF